MAVDINRVPKFKRRQKVVAVTELRRRVRNRSAIVTAFVGPLAMAVVFGLLVSGTVHCDTLLL